MKEGFMQYSSNKTRKTSKIKNKIKNLLVASKNKRIYKKLLNIKRKI